MIDTTYLEKTKKTQLLVHVIGNGNEARHLDFRNEKQRDMVYDGILNQASKLKKSVIIDDKDNARIKDFDYLSTVASAKAAANAKLKKSKK